MDVDGRPDLVAGVDALEDLAGSVGVANLALKGIDVLRWLEGWLQTCAKNGRRPPGDLSPWLP